MLRNLILLTLLTLAPAALAQDWSPAAAALQRDLAGGRAPLATFFFPDAPDPGAASRALGVAYVHIEGSAGSASIHAGLFVPDGQGSWQMLRPVEGLFGQSPRDPQAGPDGFFVKTSMLGPNDPRCCPSVETTWFIDWTTGQAVQR